LYRASLEDWIRLLRIAHQWEFIEVKNFAVRELEEFDIEPIQKINLYHANGVDRNLLIPSYTALSVRAESLTFDEGKALGMDLVIQLGAARDRVGRNVNTFATLNEGEIGEIVAALFHLRLTPASDAEPASSSQQPDGPVN
jgi:hypothetical protein